MKENSKKVLNYLKEIAGENVTAADVAAALGLEKRSVDGIFTSAIQRKGFSASYPSGKRYPQRYICSKVPSCQRWCG